MKTSAKAETGPGMSDQAVQTKTGCTWAEWCALLDRAGAAKMTHKEIATYVHEHEGCPGWWSQMVTVGYERLRGRRDHNQTPEGFQVSATKTLAVPVSAAYDAWQNDGVRQRWLPRAAFTVRKANPTKSLRIAWKDGESSLEVLFYAKGEKKSRVSVTLRTLRDAKAVEKMRKYWKDALERLKRVFEEMASSDKADHPRCRSAVRQ